MFVIPIILIAILLAGTSAIGSCVLSIICFGSIAEGGNIWILPGIYFALRTILLLILRIEKAKYGHPLS